MYAAYLAESQGWTLDEIVTVRPDDPESMLFHTPNLDLVRLQAEAWGRPYREVRARGRDEAAEMDALREAASGGQGPIVAGAIESSYQWSRLLRVADEAHRRVFAPLWRVDPVRVVREEISAGLDIRLVHLAAESLPVEWLGRQLDFGLLDELAAPRRPGPRVHPAGEGGEYESLVVDAPFFQRRLHLDAVTRDQRGSTARLVVRKAQLVAKADGTGAAG